MWAGRGLRFHSTHIWPWASHWTSRHLSCSSAGKRRCFSRLPLPSSGISYEITFTNVQVLHKILFHAIQFEKGSSIEMVSYKSVLSLDSGGEDDFRISASSIYFVTRVWQRARHGYSCRPVHGPQAISPPRSLALWLSKCCSLGNAPTLGCGKLLSLRHPPEAPARRRKAPFWQAPGSSLQSSLQDTQRWGREQNKMWMGGVKGIWGLGLHWPQPPVSFWFFSWGWAGVRQERPPSGRTCE